MQVPLMASLLLQGLLALLGDFCSPRWLWACWRWYGMGSSLHVFCKERGAGNAAKLLKAQVRT